LNRDFEVWPLVELAWNQEAIWRRLADASGQVFLRPDDGFKAFTGKPVSREEFPDWYTARQAFYLPSDTPIVVSSPVTIHSEYRCFISHGRVLAASEYKPAFSGRVPDDVVEWVEGIHQSSRETLSVYAADVARTESGLRVVELGCVPCLDFYEAEIEKLILEAERFPMLTDRR
jgi:hypothetical protein